MGKIKVDANIIEAWRAAAGDPDDQVTQWLTHGAPAGIEFPMEDPGIFPVSLHPADIHPRDLHCDLGNFRNYSGVDQSEVTEIELQEQLDKGHLLAFDSEAELRQYLGAFGEGKGGDPILNKIGLVKKTRNGVLKIRMILDTL